MLPTIGELREWAQTLGVHPADVDIMEDVARKLGNAPTSQNQDLALHCAEILTGVASVLRNKDDDSISLAGLIAAMSHTCPTHVEAAVYLLAHAFENTPGEPSPVIAWMNTLVDGLLSDA